MTMRVRGMLMLITALAMMSLAGCDHYNCNSGATFGNSSCAGGTGGLGGGGGGGTGTPVAFVYNNNGNGKIDASELDTLGNFASISAFSSPSFTQATDGGMVIVQKKWLYMPLSSGQILGYLIDGATGALSPLTLSPYSTTNSFAVTSDPAGTLLFVTGLNGGISVFQINQGDGSLTEIAGSPFASAFTKSPTTDGLGKYLYVTEGSLGQNVAAYAIASASAPVPGALTAVPNSPFAFNMSEVRGEPSGNFLLGISGLTGVNGQPVDDHINVFAIDSTGAISQVVGSPFATLYSPINIVVHPNGKFVYSFNGNTTGGNSPMEGFQLSSSGALTEFSSPFTFAPPIGMFDQSGVYLFTHPTGSLSVLTVDTSTGALTSTIPALGISGDLGWAPTDTH
jgi:6-phosphogluconolactonase (cycloisomerase 2 family)